MTSDRLWLSPKQAANVIGVSLSAVRSYIRQGRLEARRVRGSRLLRISRQDLEALLEPLRESAQQTEDTR
jgi:excisionase family DNA binding protein